MRTAGEQVLGEAPGAFAETRHGLTHYVLLDNAGHDGPLLVLIHGLGASHERYDQVAEALHSEGYRVLAYDLYDRGFSESSPTEYPLSCMGAHGLAFTLDVHVEQLTDLLAALSLGSAPLVLVGHSTGGAASIGFAAASPSLVVGLVLIDTVCVPPNKSLAARVAAVPVVGDAVVKVLGPKSTLEFARQSVYDPAANEDFFDAMRRLLDGNPRYIASMASTNRYCKGFGESLVPEFEACCRAAIPMLLIWGKLDKSTPYEHCLQLQRIAADIGKNVVEELAFPDMPHNTYYPDAKPRECAAAIAKLAASTASSAATTHGGSSSSS